MQDTKKRSYDKTVQFIIYGFDKKYRGLVVSDSGLAVGDSGGHSLALIILTEDYNQLKSSTPIQQKKKPLRYSSQFSWQATEKPNTKLGEETSAVGRQRKNLI